MYRESFPTLIRFLCPSTSIPSAGMLPRDLTGRTETHRGEGSAHHSWGLVTKLWRRQRDGRVEPREAEAYSKQYVEVGRGEPARQYVDFKHTGLS